MNEERKDAMAYVVILPPSFNQLLRYYIPETKQEAARCTLRQHRSSDKRSTAKIERVISPRSSAIGVSAYLYARRSEAMVVVVEVGAARPTA